VSETKVAVVGAGRSGAVTAACLADLGHTVCAVDVNEARVAELSRGKAPFYEPDLDELLRRNVGAKRLSFTTSFDEAISGAHYVLLSVDTPAQQNGEADLRSLSAAIRDLAPLLAEGALVITRSTVPVGTNAWIAEQVRSENPRARFDVISNPEFLREGHAVDDFLRPERVVIGAETERAAKEAARLFDGMDAPVILTDLPTAELIKYAANTFLAMSVSFINEIANICERAGADVSVVSNALRMDRRIGPDAYLSPGLGFGGSCLPKDLRALISSAGRLGYDAPLLKAVREVNEFQPKHVLGFLEDVFGNVDGLTVGVLGLSFKGNTFDLRSSPALTLIERLASAGARVRAFDPLADGSEREEMAGRAELTSNAYNAVQGCDAVIIATEHPEFAGLDLKRLRQAMQSGVLIDARNVLDGDAAARAGFTYFGIGRPRRGD
jgi:UDPglucose 6-dehydrogenase